MTADAARQARVAADLGAQLDAALERLGELSRQLDLLHEEAAERDAAVSALRESWRTVDGRTLRHEAGLDTVRELRSLVEALGERLEQEWALRREALAALTQAREHDGVAAESAVSRAQDLGQRLALVEEQARQSEAERRRLTVAVGNLDESAERGGMLLGELQSRLEAGREVERATVDGLSALEGRVGELGAQLRDLDVRTREAEADRRMMHEAVAALQATRAREAELLDLLDQQRATRLRLEERLMAVEQGLAAAGGALLEGAEQRAQLRIQVAGIDRQLGELNARFSEQRELLQRQWRAVLDADDVAEARVVSDLERRSRERRALLRRLQEESEQSITGPGGAQ
jgi:chromosome segregation ATPase